MRFDVVSLFPDMITGMLAHGVIGRAFQNGRLRLATWNPRDYATDRHRTVDDRPYGGGPGMVMKVEPLRAAIRAARRAAPRGAPVVCLSPQGQPFDQARAVELARLPGLILVAGRYEGIDERVLRLDVDLELSIGDYVLTGGELAAGVVIDAVGRLLPGVLGDADSAGADSHAAGLLDCPHYTRPERVEGLEVPAVLRGGDHAAIARWRLKQALGRTWERRPDLLALRRLTPEEQMLLEEYRAERRGRDNETD